MPRNAWNVGDGRGRDGAGEHREGRGGDEGAEERQFLGLGGALGSKVRELVQHLHLLLKRKGDRQRTMHCSKKRNQKKSKKKSHFFFFFCPEIFSTMTDLFETIAHRPDGSVVIRPLSSTITSRTIPPPHPHHAHHHHAHHGDHRQHQGRATTTTSRSFNRTLLSSTERMPVNSGTRSTRSSFSAGAFGSRSLYLSEGERPVAEGSWYDGRGGFTARGVVKHRAERGNEEGNAQQPGNAAPAPAAAPAPSAPAQQDPQAGKKTFEPFKSTFAAGASPNFNTTYNTAFTVAPFYPLVDEHYLSARLLNQKK